MAHFLDYFIVCHDLKQNKTPTLFFLQMFLVFQGTLQSLQNIYLFSPRKSNFSLQDFEIFSTFL
jgi:hypothetical protein